MAFRYEGKIPAMEYKTLRYPGHAALMQAIRELGLLDLEPVDVKGHKVVPRDLVVAALTPRLTKKDARDLIALRVVVAGQKAGKPKTLSWELVDRYDEKNGVSAMMRCTGYSLSITGQMQVRREVPMGVCTPDESMPAATYIAELHARGVDIIESET